MRFLSILLIPTLAGLASAWISDQFCHSADPSWGVRPPHLSPLPLAHPTHSFHQLYHKHLQTPTNIHHSQTPGNCNAEDMAVCQSDDPCGYVSLQTVPNLDFGTSLQGGWVADVIYSARACRFSRGGRVQLGGVTATVRSLERVRELSGCKKKST